MSIDVTFFVLNLTIQLYGLIHISDLTCFKIRGSTFASTSLVVFPQILTYQHRLHSVLVLTTHVMQQTLVLLWTYLHLVHQLHIKKGIRSTRNSKPHYTFLCFYHFSSPHYVFVSSFHFKNYKWITLLFSMEQAMIDKTSTLHMTGT